VSDTDPGQSLQILPLIEMFTSKGRCTCHLQTPFLQTSKINSPPTPQTLSHSRSALTTGTVFFSRVEPGAEECASTFKLAAFYTPQMIVDRQSQFPSTRVQEIMAGIAETERRDTTEVTLALGESSPNDRLQLIVRAGFLLKTFWS